MDHDQYEVVFRGVITEGKNVEEVKLGIARLFKVDAAKVSHLFSGQHYTIKRGIDKQTALKYKAAMLNAGALCYIKQEVRQEAPPLAERPAAAMTLAEVGAMLLPPKQTPPLKVNLSGMSMAMPGTMISEPSITPKADIDTSTFTLVDREQEQ
ncbi:MAG: hypothetical protein GXP10_08480 [Gammaproteobacteria bacterium]|nr:hypothetical protein [Gammaproteobacteria bacterium]